MSKDNGGPAFPGKRPIFNAGYKTGAFEPEPGMQLRDWFAGRALPALLTAAFEAGVGDEPEHAEPIAKAAYAMADAMLKARQS